MAVFEKRYRFTSNQHSKKGMMALIFGMISLISFFLAVLISIRDASGMSLRMGGVGFFASLFGLNGMILGIIALKEPDVFPVLPRAGFAVSLISVLLWLGVLYIGTRLV